MSNPQVEALLDRIRRLIEQWSHLLGYLSDGSEIYSSRVMP